MRQINLELLPLSKNEGPQCWPPFCSFKETARMKHVWAKVKTQAPRSMWHEMWRCSLC
ncbi:unnamed protein product [Ixodes persulcatus]